ncbi:S1 RNA-binding domain-containing protein [Streptococcus sp. X16XC17]|uniref:S1 RNA-binding domain-containing protein n=1 Tax=unclassified Streptococcus TaxID=2608887 RepID=UPI00066FC5EF|nr:MULTISPECIES: S1 RNA-binding domain-containing protein [unclassified Streptococcus]TCD45616.1 S1 RNA-binding domain-containing protein [Streptococcus sp. X16XC17]
MKIGDKIQGTITGIQSYGAFVELQDGTTGLIHISEIKTGYVDNIYQTLKVGQMVQVQVVDVDEFSQKASLSMRTLEEESHKLPRRHRFTNDRHKIGFEPFKKALPKWIEEAKRELTKKESES